METARFTHGCIESASSSLQLGIGDAARPTVRRMGDDSVHRRQDAADESADADPTYALERVERLSKSSKPPSTSLVPNTGPSSS